MHTNGMFHRRLLFFWPNLLLIEGVFAEFKRKCQ